MIRADLTQEGWPEPLDADSGNGAHLDYPLELENNEENKLLLKGVLAGLKARYADDLKAAHCELDLKVFNPARLVKLYGTKTCKGDGTPDRPHRLARIISIPETRTPVPIELLKAIAQGTLTIEAPRTQAPAHASGKIDVAAYS